MKKRIKLNDEFNSSPRLDGKGIHNILYRKTHKHIHEYVFSLNDTTFLEKFTKDTSEFTDHAKCANDISFYVKFPEFENVQAKFWQNIANDNTKVWFCVGQKGIGKTFFERKILNITESKTENSKIILRNNKNILFLPFDYGTSQQLFDPRSKKIIENRIAVSILSMINCIKTQDNGYMRYISDLDIDPEKFYDFIEKKGLMATVDRWMNGSSVEKKIKQFENDAGSNYKNPEVGFGEAAWFYYIIRFQYLLSIRRLKVDKIVLIVDNIEDFSNDIIKDIAAVFKNVNQCLSQRTNGTSVQLLFICRPESTEIIRSAVNHTISTERDVIYITPPKYLEIMERRWSILKKKTSSESHKRIDLLIKFSKEIALAIDKAFLNEKYPREHNLFFALHNYDNRKTGQYYLKLSQNCRFAAFDYVEEANFKIDDNFKSALSNIKLTFADIFDAMAYGSVDMYSDSGKENKGCLSNLFFNKEKPILAGINNEKDTGSRIKYCPSDILCAYIIKYLYKKNDYIKKEYFMDDISNAFYLPHENEKKIFARLLDEYLEEMLVGNHKKEFIVEEFGKYKISPKAAVLWKLLGEHDILFSFYRDDVYRYFEKNAIKKTLDLKKDWDKVYADKLYHLKQIFEAEKEYILCPLEQNFNKSGIENTFFDLFGKKFLSEYIFGGIEKSMNMKASDTETLKGHHFSDEIIKEKNDIVESIEQIRVKFEK